MRRRRRRLSSRGAWRSLTCSTFLPVSRRWQESLTKSNRSNLQLGDAEPTMMAGRRLLDKARAALEDRLPFAFSPLLLLLLVEPVE